jgi:hypothetical protein
MWQSTAKERSTVNTNEDKLKSASFVVMFVTYPFIRETGKREDSTMSRDKPRQYPWRGLVTM